MNQAEQIDELIKNGWMKFQPTNSLGWKFFFKRDPDPESYHPYWGVGHIYRTVFKSGIVTDGIVETRYQREKRRYYGILFRDFRGIKF